MKSWAGAWCDKCGCWVDFIFEDNYLKRCEGPGIHLIGWTGQLWLPHIPRTSSRRAA